jgi:hypothetical protein
MNNIQAVKIGNMVNISLNGKLYKKNCGTPKEADELFKIVLKAKENPDDKDAFKQVRIALNEKLRTALMCGIEADVETGEAYLAGFNTPIPETLLEVMKEYHENKYPLEPIINFWKLLMVNPDTRIRTTLFDFISTHDFVLTDKGYMLVYKAVYHKEKEQTEASQFEEFISKQYLHIKKNWNCSPNKYVGYKEKESGELKITKYNTAKNWDEKEKGIEIIGKIGDLYEAIITKENAEENTNTVYTDMHSRTMSIIVGEPCVMPRTECDSDPANECSYGLHVGATKYVERFGNGSSTILACLVNPANVVAVPKYDNSKMRVTEYFPIAVATYEDGKIDIVEQKYFEDDYANYEVDELEAQIEKIQAEELPIATAKGAEKETRPMSELQAMLESRLVDIV